MKPFNISGTQAARYYYEKDPVFQSNDSQWHGKLAEEFKLSGPCQKADFLNIISGNHPISGKQIIQDGVNGEHRAGIDFPMAAPKSISVMALHVGDTSIIDAHKKAVESTVEFIERNYIYCRKTENRITTAFRTENGIFASFPHSTNRANEPHLHSHLLIMNMTHTRSGWRATFNDRLFKDQILIGHVYQNELAKNIRELGYGIENEGNGRWGIKGFKRQWVDAFSSRVKEIDETIAALGKDDVKSRNQAQKSSRAEKQRSISVDDLKRNWEEKVAADEIKKSVALEKDRDVDFGKTKLSSADYITISYKSINENESTFTKQDVLKIALDLSRGEYTVDDLDKAYLKHIKEGSIECLKSEFDNKRINTDIYTSREIKLTEYAILSAFNQHKDSLREFSAAGPVRDFIDKRHGNLTKGQRDLVQSILTSRNHFGIVQGDAGTGKTFALKVLKGYLDQRHPDVEVIGLGYTGKAAHEIMESAEIKSQTIHSFLMSSSSVPPDKQSLWLVDESSMLGSFQMKALMDKAMEHHAKVIFIGDGKQLQAISAGRMFKDLQVHGHVQVKMEEVIRQKTAYMQKAVAHVKAFQEGRDIGGSGLDGIDKAFRLLEEKQRVYKISDYNKRIQRAARFLLESENKDKALIVTPINEDRIEINEILHQKLKAPEQAEITAAIRTPAYLPGTSRLFAGNYKKGQTAFVEKSGTPDLKAGREVTIIGVDRTRNRLSVSDSKNKYFVDLHKDNTSLSVYNVSERSFFEGEKVVFLKNDKYLQVSNGQTGTIETLGPRQTIQVKLDGTDRIVGINLKSYPYIDRGYAVTVHKSQGQTARDVLLLSSSSNASMNRTETFYVALSRAENNFTLLTDNINALKEQFKSAQPKSSVLEFANTGGN